MRGGGGACVWVGVWCVGGWLWSCWWFVRGCVCLHGCACNIQTHVCMHMYLCTYTPTPPPPPHASVRGVGVVYVYFFLPSLASTPPLHVCMHMYLRTYTHPTQASQDTFPPNSQNHPPPSHELTHTPTHFFSKKKIPASAGGRGEY